ncbi:MAG TPA: restriction endonuclease [Bacteroidales bacterium]|nr:restriction endonuclease [Bacteroidales bacterium]
MDKNFVVKKHSGEQEEFNPAKLLSSLMRSGVDEGTAKLVMQELYEHLYDGITTEQIYRKAFRLLQKKLRTSAARYSLKKAIMEMGPSGHPFEHLVGAIIGHLGYQFEVGVTFRGKCVSHELDVLARNSHEMFMVECKYYNSQGKNCNVQVPLYINSRFNDVKAVWELNPANKGLKFSGWVVTNTRFSSDAADYGKCAGLNLIGWDYPRGNSLRELIERYGLFPVTALTTLSKKQKDMLLGANQVLCRQLLENKAALGMLGLDKKDNQKVLNEIIELTGVQP